MSRRPGKVKCEPGVAVYQEVGGEGGAPLEALAALLALKHLLRAVNGSEEDRFETLIPQYAASPTCAG